MVLVIWQSNISPYSSQVPLFQKKKKSSQVPAGIAAQMAAIEERANATEDDA
jgi:hypothetical protein